jgi:hypothetical protein
MLHSLRQYGLIAVLSCIAPAIASELDFVVEPDAFSEGAVLNTVSPGVVLATTLDDNIPVPLLPVTANADPFGFAPTGTHVFGHANVYFWNNYRRLRMDFTSPVTAVQIDFSGSLTPHIGRLAAYDAQGTLLEVSESNLISGGTVTTLTLSRPQADIAWALAYATGDADFGRLDHLVYTVPEPAGMLLLGLAAARLRVRTRRAG